MSGARDSGADPAFTSTAAKAAAGPNPSPEVTRVWSPDLRDRVVVLSADDLDAIIQAIVYASRAATYRDGQPMQIGLYNRVMGISEELRSKFDLPETD